MAAALVGRSYSSQGGPGPQNRRRGLNHWLTAASVLLAFLSPVHPDSSAYILNQHLQLVTSSSLKWVNARSGEMPLHSVQGGLNGTSSPLYVCRSSQGGPNYDVGHLAPDGCHTLAGDTLQLHEANYQVLVNVEASARLAWQYWSHFNPMPRGAVSVEQDVFVAREWLKSGSDGGNETNSTARWVGGQSQLGHHLGHVQMLGGLFLREDYGTVITPSPWWLVSRNSRRRAQALGHDSSAGWFKAQRLQEGQVLVEATPSRYEIIFSAFPPSSSAFSGSSYKVLNSSEVTMERTVTLTGKDREDLQSGKVVQYEYEDLLYFGKGHNIPTGSTVSLQDRRRKTSTTSTTSTTFDEANASNSVHRERATEKASENEDASFGEGLDELEMSWGLPSPVPRTHKIRLSYDLPLNSFANVQMLATRTELRVDYEATLATHYPDGAVLLRPIKGAFRRVVHRNFRPSYGLPVFYITTTTSTTTTTTTSSSARPVQDNWVDPALANQGRRGRPENPDKASKGRTFLANFPASFEGLVGPTMVIPEQTGTTTTTTTSERPPVQTEEAAMKANRGLKGRPKKPFRGDLGQVDYNGLNYYITDNDDDPLFPEDQYDLDGYGEGFQYDDDDDEEGSDEVTPNFRSGRDFVSCSPSPPAVGPASWPGTAFALTLSASALALSLVVVS